MINPIDCHRLSDDYNRERVRVIKLNERIAELEAREQKFIKALSVLMPECEMNNRTQPALAVLGELVDDIPAEKRPLRWECEVG
jgi:hypothetical protein